jgi:hypothetical protein
LLKYLSHHDIVGGMSIEVEARQRTISFEKLVYKKILAITSKNS